MLKLNYFYKIFKNKEMSQSDIGLVGLAVMGQNLAMNIYDHGYSISVYNRSSEKIRSFMEGLGKNTSVKPCFSLEELVNSLSSPRRIILMVKAGEVVDRFIENLLPFLDEGDILIDGGNSLYSDTERRVEFLEKKKISFVGAGISGGEEGARFGPSIMPGGSKQAWVHIKDIFQSIAAQAQDSASCCSWIGSGGSGHYVKMVHNGIEYGDMQLICEAYHLLKSISCSNEELSRIFARWNKGKLNSFLIEITANIFSYKEGGEFLVDKILDLAGQKGTGKWTSINALDLGVPLTLISEAVFARFVSSFKESRVKAARELEVSFKAHFDKEELISKIENALYVSKLISYVQGFMLLSSASQQYGWNLNYGEIALVWREGCIIRSSFLNKIKEAFEENPNLESLLLAPFFKENILRCQSDWREVINAAISLGVPMPCFSSALSFFDSYRCASLPINLLQAQRDYFGAHTYQRIDKGRGKFFHTNWTGKGGDVSSSTYLA